MLCHSFILPFTWYAVGSARGGQAVRQARSGRSSRKPIHDGGLLESFNPSTSLRLTRRIPLGPEEDLPFASFGPCAGAQVRQVTPSLAYHSLLSPGLVVCPPGGAQRLAWHDAFNRRVLGPVALGNNEATHCTCRSLFRRSLFIIFSPYILLMNYE
jgi:hypothetical protein